MLEVSRRLERARPRTAVVDHAVIGQLARRLIEHLDPDGILEDEKYRERRREFTMRNRIDGSASVCGEPTAECAGALRVMLACLAAPRPGADGTRDPRTMNGAQLPVTWTRARQRIEAAA